MLKKLTVTLAYAPTADTHQLCTLQLSEGSTTMDALKASGLFSDTVNFFDLPIGVFSKKVSHDYLLEDGDRLEIYRPLSLDPKKQRIQKAKQHASNPSS